MRKQLFLLSSVCAMALTATDDVQARRKLVPNLPSVQIHYEALDTLKRNDYRMLRPAPQQSIATPAASYVPPRQVIRKPIKNDIPAAPNYPAPQKKQPKLQWQVGPAGQKLPDSAMRKAPPSAAVRKPINAPILTPYTAEVAPTISQTPKAEAKPKKITTASPPKPAVKAPATTAKIDLSDMPKLPPITPQTAPPKTSAPKIKAPLPTLPPLKPLKKELPPLTSPAIEMTPPIMPKLPPLQPKAIIVPTSPTSTPPKEMPKLPPLKPMPKTPLLPKSDDLPPSIKMRVTTRPAMDLKSMPPLPPLGTANNKPDLPELPDLPPLKPLEVKKELPNLPPVKSAAPELPPLPDKLDLPPLTQLPPKKDITAGKVNIKPKASALPSTSSPSGLPPLPHLSIGSSLPELPPLPDIESLERSAQSQTSNQALNLAQRHNTQNSLPPLPGMPPKTQTFVKNKEEEVASLNTRDLPPLPVQNDKKLSSADSITSKGTPSASIAFSQMERAVPLTSYSELKKIAERVKADESKGVTILAYAYGSDDQSQLAKRAALARMMAIRTFLIEEGGLDNTQINAMTPKQDAHADGKERVDIFIR